MAGGGFSRERLARLHRALAAHVTAGDLPGVVALVSRRGETSVEAVGTQSFGGAAMRRDTIFRIASMTKPVIAAATLLLIEEGKLRLDDPVDGLLPELANRKVLKALDGPVEDTVPARRAITTRDLLTFTFGAGAIMVWPAKHPIQKAAADSGLAPGPFQLDLTADEFMRSGSVRLPLVYQPGERWLYHTGSDVLGVLIARASGQPLQAFLQERLFAPLGMRDTGFHVPAAKLDLPYQRLSDGPAKEGIGLLRQCHRQPLEQAAAVCCRRLRAGRSTVDDGFHAFYRMLMSGGILGRERILSRPTVVLMTSDQLTAEQRQGAELFFGTMARAGAWAVRVVTRRTDIFATPGRFGWGRRLWHLGASRSGRGHDRHPDDPAADGLAHTATRIPRFLDLRLPGLRRLIEERAMPIEVSAFRWVSAVCAGLRARPRCVRWALEEAALPYHAALVDQQACASAGYRGWQPFGQVPAYRDGEVEMFEIGRDRAAHRGEVEGAGAGRRGGAGAHHGMGDRGPQLDRTLRSDADPSRGEPGAGRVAAEPAAGAPLCRGSTARIISKAASPRVT